MMETRKPKIRPYPGGTLPITQTRAVNRRVVPGRNPIQGIRRVYNTIQRKIRPIFRQPALWGQGIEMEG
jgi:hypothetical protein